MRFPFARFRIVGHSMEPTLREGDGIVVARFAYRKHPPRVGDLIAFRRPGDPRRVFVKRVVAVSERGEAVVLGENRCDSLDSRAFGPVPKTHIVGRVVFRY